MGGGPHPLRGHAFATPSPVSGARVSGARQQCRRARDAPPCRWKKELPVHGLAGRRSEFQASTRKPTPAPFPSATPPQSAGWTATGSGAVDRFVRCPVGLARRLITSMGRSTVTLSRHLPLPSPSPPLNPSPDSSCCAVSVSADPAASPSSARRVGSECW